MMRLLSAARRTLAFLALVLFCAAWWSVSVSLTAFGILLSPSAACATAAGALGYIERRRGDCGYSETPFGRVTSPPYVRCVSAPSGVVESRTIHSPAVALTVIEGGRRAVWPDAAGAPE